MQIESLITTIAKELVDDVNSVKVTHDEPLEDGTITYHLSVSPDDMGRVIGKQGKIARAFRSILRAAAVKSDQKIVLEIDD